MYKVQSQHIPCFLLEPKVLYSEDPVSGCALNQMIWFYIFTPCFFKFKFIPPMSISWMVFSLWVFQLKFCAYFLHPYLSCISESFRHNCCNHPNDTLLLLWIFDTILFFFVSFLEYWFNGYIPCWRYCFTLALDDTQKKQYNIA